MKVRHALAEELRLIGELNYAPFFLTVHDVVQFARNEEKILCQGRGSAANSVICYCLGITDVDPLKIDLLFERFVSAERREPPDIDVDFEHERREKVIQHIYKTYTRERAGLAATVICYRGRSAIRDVGKVFGLSEDTIGALAGSLWGWSMDGVSAQEARRIGLDPADRRLKMARSFAHVLTGFPRHLSQHVGGFVITRSRLDEVVPIENAAMEDRTVIEWDKDDLDAVGLLKVDVLGLGMLSCLRRAFELLQTHYGVTRDLSMQDEDAATYRMIQRADTIGVFQIESRAQMSMLPRLKPKEFYDLVIEVAIVRPGPIQGDMVHPYLRRRQGLEPVRYPSPELEAILHKTLGVPLFQEHAMRIAIVAAGFEPAEADKLRRAMATFKRVGTIKYFRDKFINGMASRGYELRFRRPLLQPDRGLRRIRLSGKPRGELRQPGLCLGLDQMPPSRRLRLRAPQQPAHGLLCGGPDRARCAGARRRGAAGRHQSFRLGLRPRARRRRRASARAPASAPRRDARRHPPDPCAAARLPPDQRIFGSGRAQDRRRAGDGLRFGARSLAAHRPQPRRHRAAGASRCVPLARPRPPRRAVGGARPAALRRQGRPAAVCSRAMPELEPDIALPPMLLGEHVVEDYRRLHLSLKAHPVAFLRHDLARRGILRHDQLPAIASGRRVSVGGLVLVRQRPGTAAGVIFMTLEDETAIANTIVWPKIFETFRPIVLGARLISVTGKLQNESGVIHVVAERVEDLTPLLRRLSQDHGCVEALARADAVKHPAAPDPHPHRHPRAGDALVTLFKDEPALAGQLGFAAGRHAEGPEFSLSFSGKCPPAQARWKPIFHSKKCQTKRAVVEQHWQLHLQVLAGTPGQDDLEKRRKPSNPRMWPRSAAADRHQVA